MDICLSHAVLDGHLSNEIPNIITGEIRLAGIRSHLHIELSGNFMRDIAGCRLDFSNPTPNFDPAAPLPRHQMGFAGEITASRRLHRMQRRHQPQLTIGHPYEADSKGLKNALYFEWYGDLGQDRYLIMASHWMVKVSAPQWTMTKDDEWELVRTVRTRRKEFLLGRNQRD